MYMLRDICQAGPNVVRLTEDSHCPADAGRRRSEVPYLDVVKMICKRPLLNTQDYLDGRAY
ncbi:hypothetical protein B0G75_103273 [Paraburkholderia sp. BL18I3N2]|nr:hypothetical protein B0G75_103273 [Paraburkholderia sp. BL18I3N2]